MGAMTSSGPHHYRTAVLIVAVSLYVTLSIAAAMSGRSAFSVAGLLLMLTILLWPSLAAARRGAWALWLAVTVIMTTALATGYAAAALDTLAIAINGLIGWTFARTLKPGREPLITLLVRQIEGEQRTAAPGIAQYTRSLTAVWAIIMCLQAAALLLIWLQLHFGLPFPPSAALSPWLHRYLRFGSYLVIVVLFVGEHFWRRHYLSHLAHMPFLMAGRRIADNWQQLMRDSIR